MVASRTARPFNARDTVATETSADAIRDALYRQAYGPVRWVEVVQALKARGLRHVFECGPGRVLARIVTRIDGEITTANVLDPETLAAAKALLP